MRIIKIGADICIPMAIFYYKTSIYFGIYGLTYMGLFSLFYK